LLTGDVTRRCWCGGADFCDRLSLLHQNRSLPYLLSWKTMSIVQSATKQFEAVKADGIATYKSLDACLSKVDLLKKIEGQTKVKPIHAVSGIAVSSVLFLLFGFGANALTNLVGFIYPLYASFTALKSPSSEDDT
ncbi:hypothetical protein BVRB_037570, partial [Beta vulgaris subsp. vulgaris]